VFLFLLLPLILLLLMTSRSLGQRAIAMLLMPSSCDTSEKNEIKINKTCRNYGPLLMLRWELITSFRLNFSSLDSFQKCRVLFQNVNEIF
jgi:hypothetical protein